MISKAISKEKIKLLYVGAFLAAVVACTAVSGNKDIVNMVLQLAKIACMLKVVLVLLEIMLTLKLIAREGSHLRFSGTAAGGNLIHTLLIIGEKLGYIELRMMKLIWKRHEMARHLKSDIEAAGPEAKEEAVRNLAEEWLGARLMLRDLNPPLELVQSAGREFLGIYREVQQEMEGCPSITQVAQDVFQLSIQSDSD